MQNKRVCLRPDLFLKTVFCCILNNCTFERTENKQQQSFNFLTKIVFLLFSLKKKKTTTKQEAPQGTDEGYPKMHLND